MLLQGAVINLCHLAEQQGLQIKVDTNLQAFLSLLKVVCRGCKLLRNIISQRTGCFLSSF